MQKYVIRKMEHYHPTDGEWRIPLLLSLVFQESEVSIEELTGGDEGCFLPGEYALLSSW